MKLPRRTGGYGHLMGILYTHMLIGKRSQIRMWINKLEGENHNRLFCPLRNIWPEFLQSAAPTFSLKSVKCVPLPRNTNRMWWNILVKCSTATSSGFHASERPKEIPKGMGWSSFGWNISAEIHLPIQPTAISVIHYSTLPPPLLWEEIQPLSDGFWQRRNPISRKPRYVRLIAPCISCETKIQEMVRNIFFLLATAPQRLGKNVLFS